MISEEDLKKWREAEAAQWESSLYKEYTLIKERLDTCPPASVCPNSVCVTPVYFESEDGGYSGPFYLSLSLLMTALELRLTTLDQLFLEETND